MAPVLTRRAGEVWTGVGLCLEFVPVLFRQVSTYYVILCQANRWRCVDSRGATISKNMDYGDQFQKEF